MRVRAFPMAEVFKKQTTAWRLDGKKVSPGTPGAERVKLQSRKWYGTVNGKHVPLCRDKSAAQRLLNKLLTDAAMRQHGIADPFEAHRKRPLADHLIDFTAALRAKG